MQNQLALSAVIRCILKPHHSLLRKELERAADLTSSVVIEQRPPLCRVLLPLYRLFQEFRGDLEDHLDGQEARLFPRLLEIEVALRKGEFPHPCAEEISEVLRLLKDGQIALTHELDEMRELTHGFMPPVDACECYGELQGVLAGIQIEVPSEVRMEGSMLSAGGGVNGTGAALRGRRASARRKASRIASGRVGRRRRQHGTVFLVEAVRGESSLRRRTLWAALGD